MKRLSCDTQSMTHTVDKEVPFSHLTYDPALTCTAEKNVLQRIFQDSQRIQSGLEKRRFNQSRGEACAFSLEQNDEEKNERKDDKICVCQDHLSFFTESHTSLYIFFFSKMIVIEREGIEAEKKKRFSFSSLSPTQLLHITRHLQHRVSASLSLVLTHPSLLSSIENKSDNRGERK